MEKGFMGKKPQKTKELSVAIAEASSTGDETQQEQQPQTRTQQQTQPQAPRKRGRPRKIVVKTEIEEKRAQPIEQAAGAAASTAAQGAESSMKKGEEEQHEGSSFACMRITKEEEVSKDGQLPKGEPSRSRARRKSKPRKSS